MKRDAALTSRIMASVRSKNTAPEVKLQKILRGLNRSYKLHCSKLPGRPDVVLHRERLAIFVDGDFWHGRQWRRRGLACLEDQFRKCSNADYWISKIRRNIVRDRRVSKDLREKGWHVLRIWESDLTSGGIRGRQKINRMLARLT